MEDTPNPLIVTLARSFWRHDIAAQRAPGTFEDLPAADQARYMLRAMRAVEVASEAPAVPARFRAMRDGDDARDALADYQADLDAQYNNYVSECADRGIAPLPREAVF